MNVQRWVSTAGVCLTMLVAAGCSGAATGNSAEAATPAESTIDPIDELTATLAEMGVHPSPAAQELSERTPTDVVILGDRSAVTPDEIVSDVGAEVALLREHVYQLESSLTFYMDTVVTDLREENAYLRDELARVYAAIPLEDRMRPVVPRRGAAALNDIQDLAANPNYTARTNESRRDPSAPLRIVIAKEWGRTPAEATEIGKGVTSLRGIIGSVAQGAGDEALLQLGRELREQYDEYANINIVVFDSEGAATAYADRNAKSTTRHVLTIARHAQSGIDEMYLYRNGIAVQTERF